MQSFQQIILTLKQYWADRGCVIQEPYDIEVGAGTMCPETFLRVLGPEPYRVAYVQPSRRPADGRYGDNPNRLYKHSQLQVILKTAPNDVIEQYLGSLPYRVAFVRDGVEVAFEVGIHDPIVAVLEQVIHSPQRVLGPTPRSEAVARLEIGR